MPARLAFPCFPGVIVYVLKHNESFLVNAAVDACLWLLATGMAFWCIRGRRIEQHRQWMTRSFAMAIVFLQVRVILGVSGWETLGVAVVETVVWTCVAFAYPLADLVLLIEDRLRTRGAQPERDSAANQPAREQGVTHDDVDANRTIGWNYERAKATGLGLGPM